MPSRVGKKNKAVIFCGGMPGMPKSGILEFFAKKGYWAFLPRYRGSWESGGRFLRVSPDHDIKDVINGIYRPFRDLGTGKIYRFKPKEVVLVGSSFGGPAAVLNSRHRCVSKVVLLSPVVDWTDPSTEEPIETFWKLVRGAFGEGYRFSKKDWDKLQNGKFYNPVGNLQKIDGRKVFIIHARDDYVVRFGAVKKFAEKIGAQSLFLSRGGHLGSKALTKPAVYRRIAKFLRTYSL